MALSSYIQDTADLLRALDGVVVPEGAWLVAIDVEALYNLIPHDLGVRVVDGFILERGSRAAIYSAFILGLLHFILTTFFCSTAPTTTRCRDSLSKVLIWYRLIEDIFVIWTGSREELFSFLEVLKLNYFNLKFTMNYDQRTINFLDMQIFINDGSMGSSLFRKPSAGNTILHATSSHPRPLFTSIPYSQYLRLKRNCSRQEDYETEAKALQNRLLARGYSRSCLKKAYHRANLRDRDTYIANKYRSKNLINNIFLRTASAGPRYYS